MTALNNLPVRNDLILPVHMVPQTLLQIQLNKLDLTAARRVKEDEPAPGPFGSAIMFYNTATQEHFLLNDRHDSNRVNRDGPQAHAEAVSLYPENFAQATAKLEELKKDTNWVVVFLTTGESCPSCFTKQRIAVNDWMRKGLIDKGRVLNFFGADYDMTQAVAGFSDKNQLLDMQNNPNGSPQGVVNFINRGFLELEPDVQTIFRSMTVPAAVLYDRNSRQVYAVACDTREQTRDPMATAEMNVIKQASDRKRKEGAGEPWNLSGMTLVSSTDLASAPLARTAMFWASIDRGYSIRSTPYFNGHKTVEAPDMSNEQLYRAATERPYNGDASLIYVFQASQSGLHRFRNLAQTCWKPRVALDAARGKNIHYDGGGTAPACC